MQTLLATDCSNISAGKVTIQLLLNIVSDRCGIHSFLFVYLFFTLSCSTRVWASESGFVRLHFLVCREYV